MLRYLRHTPFPVGLLVVSFLAPTELSFYAAGLRLPPHRIALILILPFALARLLQSRGPRVRVFDVALLGYTGWMVLMLTLHGEGNSGLVFASSLALESFGAFLVARAYVRSETEFRATLATLLAATLCSALIALPETFLGRHFTHDALQALTHYYHPRVIEKRMGLVRAYGTFDHPIHLGTFAASLLALSWFAVRRTGERIAAIAIVMAAVLAALSSAPMLCAAMQVALIVWEALTRGLARRVALTLVLVGLAFAAISLVATRSPFALIATGFTLDPWTGYYRLMIWEYGLAAVFANPVTGIGLNDWERPEWMYSDTVDAFWLVIAMRTGFPGILLLATAIALVAAGVARGARRAGSRRTGRIAAGWAIALIAIALAAATVHLWNVVHTYFFFFLGLTCWIADPVRSRRRVRAARGSPSRRVEPVRVRWSAAPAAMSHAGHARV